MFPTYQEYYSDFLQRISVLPESVQSPLISILKLRCESGILPHKNYGDNDEYFDYRYRIPEELVGFLDRFDKEFYPSELVEAKFKQESIQIIFQMINKFNIIKSRGIQCYTSNPLNFMIELKKIFDSQLNSTHELVNKMVINKRADFDKLIIKYYEDMVLQEELDSLVGSVEFHTISDLSSKYHEFLTTRFMVFGIKLSTEAVETRKKLEQVCQGDNSELYLERCAF